MATTNEREREREESGLLMADEVDEDERAEADVWKSGHWAFCGSGAHDGTPARPAVALAGWSQVDLEARAQAVGWGWDSVQRVWLCPPCRTSREAEKEATGGTQPTQPRAHERE